MAAADRSWTGVEVFQVFFGRCDLGGGHKVICEWIRMANQGDGDEGDREIESGNE